MAKGKNKDAAPAVAASSKDARDARSDAAASEVDLDDDEVTIRTQDKRSFDMGVEDEVPAEILYIFVQPDKGGQQKPGIAGVCDLRCPAIFLHKDTKPVCTEYFTSLPALQAFLELRREHPGDQFVDLSPVYDRPKYVFGALARPLRCTSTVVI